MLQAIIFDCDGVLLDTLEANRHFYNAILGRLGYNHLNEHDLYVVHAMTVGEAFAYALSPEDAAKAPEVAQSLDRDIYFNKVRVPDNLYELLTALKRNYKLGIVTNRDARGVGMLNDFNLLEYFDAVISCSDVKEPKPAPEGLLKICKLFGITPAEALYVGDSNSDQLAALAANMPFVAYASPGLKSDRHAKNMLQLEQLIDNLAKNTDETLVS